MKYSNFKKIDFLLIFKISLCLYILLAVYIKHNILLKLVDDNGIKILLLILIIYFTEKDYIISLLLSICLIIMITLYNKNNIETIKKNYILENKILNNKKEFQENIDDNKFIDNEDEEDNDNANNAILNIEKYEDELDKIQSNIFNKKNNSTYFSGNYTNALITTQGKLELDTAN